MLSMGVSSTMSTKSVVFCVLRLSVTLGILYYLLHKIPLYKVIGSLASANINYVLPACLISILLQFFILFRLKFLVDRQGMSVSALRVFDINLGAVFYRLFLPGGNLTEAAVRYYKLSRGNNQRAEALAAVIFDRVVATIALCIVGVLFWVVDSRVQSIDMIFIVLVLLVGLALVYSSELRKSNIVSFIEFYDFVKLPFLSQKLRSLFRALNKYNSLSLNSFSYIFTLSIIVHLLGILIYYLSAVSIGIDMSFITFGWIRAAVIIITMIPISISGLGVREGAVVFFLKSYGVGGKEALALSFLVFGITIVEIGAIGGLLEGRKLLFPRFNK